MTKVKDTKPYWWLAVGGSGKADANCVVNIYAPGLPRAVSEWKGPAAIRLATEIVAKLNQEERRAA